MAVAATTLVRVADLVAGVISDPRATPEERAEWAAKARSLTVGDLRDELRAARTGREEPQPDPEAAAAAWLGRRLRVLADRLELDPLLRRARRGRARRRLPTGSVLGVPGIHRHSGRPGRSAALLHPASVPGGRSGYTSGTSSQRKEAAG